MERCEGDTRKAARTPSLVWIARQSLGVSVRQLHRVPEPRKPISYIFLRRDTLSHSKPPPRGGPRDGGRSLRWLRRITPRRSVHGEDGRRRTRARRSTSRRRGNPRWPFDLAAVAG